MTEHIPYKQKVGGIGLEVSQFGSYTISIVYNDSVTEKLDRCGQHYDDLRGLHYMLSEAIRLGAIK